MLSYLSGKIAENKMRNWEPLPLYDPNDILDLSAFKSINNTSMDSLPEKLNKN